MFCVDFVNRERTVLNLSFIQLLARRTGSCHNPLLACNIVALVSVVNTTGLVNTAVYKQPWPPAAAANVTADVSCTPVVYLVPSSSATSDGLSSREAFSSCDSIA